jgi:acetylornithine deacetylase/succinyl-diaminopimelate desuccinylase-like protein
MGYPEYLGYRMTSYPEPAEGDVSREEAVRIAKKALNREKAALDSAVLTEYEGSRTWLVTLGIFDWYDGKEDPEAGSWTVAVDSRSGKTESIRETGKDGEPFMAYIHPAAYEKCMEGRLSEGDCIRIAAEAITGFPFGWRGRMANANIGVIRGGTGTNVVCDDVFLKGEIRSASREEGEACLQGIVEHFRRTCSKYGGSLDVEWEWDFRPYEIREDDIPYKRFARAAAACGLEAVPQPTMGGSDANTYNHTGLKAINLGVGAQNPHGNDEFILYEDLQKASDIAYYLLTEKQ